MIDDRLIAGIELGGTKAIAVLGRAGEIVEQHTVPTTSTEETLGALAQCLRRWGAEQGISALGIASFGPIRIDPGAADYGTILDTPKPGWRGAKVGEILGSALDCPLAIDTDVNGAALAEYRWGAGQGCNSLCYITIGTGVGGGLLIGGLPVHGAMHPEIGHLRLRRSDGDDFAGACPFHRDCIEGLISGPALAERLGSDPAHVAHDDPRWLHVASDIAELVAAVLLTVSANRVLIGGGVGMGRRFLLPLVRAKLLERLGGYLQFVDDRCVEHIVCSPALEHDAGPLGALALGMMAADKAEGFESAKAPLEM